MESDSESINNIQPQSINNIELNKIPDNNKQSLNNFHDSFGLEKEKYDKNVDYLENEKNILDLIPKDLMNEIMINNPKKEESFEEKDKYSNNQEDSLDDNNEIDELKNIFKIDGQKNKTSKLLKLMPEENQSSYSNKSFKYSDDKQNIFHLYNNKNMKIEKNENFNLGPNMYFDTNNQVNKTDNIKNNNKDNRYIKNEIFNEINISYNNKNKELINLDNDIINNSIPYYPKNKLKNNENNPNYNESPINNYSFIKSFNIEDNSKDNRMLQHNPINNNYLNLNAVNTKLYNNPKIDQINTLYNNMNNCINLIKLIKNKNEQFGGVTQKNIQNNNSNNLYNINKNYYYNNSFINIVNNNKISEKIENNNLIDRKLESEDYLIEMFGRAGWICKACNNFNFETRNKCNRCHVIKMPKTKEEIFKKTEKKKNKKKIKERKTDWFCLNCYNINYGFRKNCNKCKIERKEEYPSIYLEPNQKIEGNNNTNLILMNNIDRLRMYFNSSVENNSNYFANNNVNNYINDKIQNANIVAENNFKLNKNNGNSNNLNE